MMNILKKNRIFTINKYKNTKINKKKYMKLYFKILTTQVLKSKSNKQIYKLKYPEIMVLS